MIAMLLSGTRVNGEPRVDIELQRYKFVNFFKNNIELLYQIIEKIQYNGTWQSNVKKYTSTPPRENIR